MKNLTDLPEWHALAKHQADIAPEHLRDWFAANPARSTQFSLSLPLKQGHILLDYSRNRIQPETMKLLIDLANAVKLPEKIKALFAGDPINTSENKAAMHTALRNPAETIMINGENVAPSIQASLQHMTNFVERVHSGEWKGITGKPIKHIVNIGIGGSYLGPRMCTQALRDFAVSDLKFHFLSGVDPANLQDVFQAIDPETTLFIVSSKSLTTIETLTNTRSVIAWMKERLGDKVVPHHFIAVSAATDKAEALGIPAAQVFTLWDWVGGRYSIWSAIGLTLMLMIGEKHFRDFLAGAHTVDKHVQQTDFTHNMPVILGLLSIWYTNFFHTKAHAIIPYAHRLRHLIAYLQQAEMESNGKSVDLDGNTVTYATGPVIFGEEGCNGQHAYHQLLHQGPDFIPADFILVGQTTENIIDNHQTMLLASGLSQTQALMRGKTYEEAYDALIERGISKQDAEKLARHQVIPGNRPSNVILLDRITPESLGALLAIYEHQIFVQGAVWGINSFDQWGVELGKQLLPAILKEMESNKLMKTDIATEQAKRIKHA